MFGFIVIKSNVFVFYIAVTNVSMNTIGKSLGHKSTSTTMVYARMSADPVRESMQKATDKMLELSK